MDYPKTILTLVLSTLLLSACTGQKKEEAAPRGSSLLSYSAETLDSLYSHYSVPGELLLRENYPHDTQDYTATYLASDEQKEIAHPYAYLWPYSGTFSAMTALMKATRESPEEHKRYHRLLDERVLPGLELYLDTERQPAGYASYLKRQPLPDRFYDDNVWLGIDFTDLYELTGEEAYLDRAKLIWTFVESGRDDRLGDGIYWCEQKKHSKNTCSNAPGAVFALKLYRATADTTYLKKGRDLYEWTQKTLQDSTDHLYYDHITMEGEIGAAKFAYNSGQMIQAAALLYAMTGEEGYLADAQTVAAACHDHFFSDFTPAEGEPFRMLNKGDVWFTAVMLRGFVELYVVDGDRRYLDSFKRSLEYAWDHAREETGLFNSDFTGHTQDPRKWLLTQAAMVEMYATLSTVY